MYGVSIGYTIERERGQPHERYEREENMRRFQLRS